ncbi:MAG: hypothetical protein IKX99_06685 [Lachnospiraceae bacterium]|nr:hypothetical protein [Lachnospiraceae bacterium]
MLMGFIIWTIVGLVIIGFGISAFFAKKPVGFWANAETTKIKDGCVKEYNRATGILFICYAIVFILLGAPLLYGRNNPYLIFSMIGVVFATIATMAIYSIVIEEKYREK